MKRDIEYEQAQLEAADDIAEMELAKVQQVKSEQPHNQQEREALIAEAYRLTGRIEAFSTFAKFADVGTLIMLKQIKDNKIYKDMPSLGTWENYCQSIGMSRSKVDEDLKNLEMFGEAFLADIGSFGLGYRELRKLRSAASEGTLSITDNSITIEVIDGETTKQETIPLNDKDELKEALERIITAKDEALAAKDRELKAQEKLTEFNKNEWDKSEKQLLTATKELNKLTGKGVINGVPSDDYPIFSRLSSVASDITGIYAELKQIHAETLSDNNTQYLHGTIMYMVQLASELSFLVPAGIGDMEATPDEIDEIADGLPLPGIRNLPNYGKAER
ncbi:MAG: hypothetical protein AB7E48_00440 [Deferribacterales bacterium]